MVSTGQIAEEKKCERYVDEGAYIILSLMIGLTIAGLALGLTTAIIFEQPLHVLVPLVLGGAWLGCIIGYLIGIFKTFIVKDPN